ncbi:EamA family transporter [Aureimonas psammosilenae]|uniref:EamA family transporter n=1 Tax=Aureimonas psammosilenae TaxID=2495496 RepID=UPI0012610FC6|nr:EamA family transporter [Aureimonas psammosilenae]
MSTTVFGIVLLAAALHAAWNAVVKASGDKLLSATGVVGAAGLLSALALPFAPVPAMASWPFLAASTALQCVYLALLAKAYHLADMSRTYPLMRGVAPLLVAGFGALFLGEHPSLGMGAGIALIGLGVLSLSLEARGKASTAGRGVALSNAFVIAGYTLVDGAGVRVSQAPVGYILWLFTLNALVFVGGMALLRGRDLARHLSREWRSALFGGFGTLASYGLALWAMTQAPVASVAALRETAILFGIAIATLVLKEPVGARRFFAAALVTLGAGLIRLG